MKRIRLVLAVAAMMAAMVMFAAPAMADNDRHDNRADRIEERLDNRADRLEEHLENLGFDVDVDVEDVDEGAFLVSPFLLGINGFDVDVDDGLVLEFD